MGPDGLKEPECNGICLTPADIGLPEYGGPGVVAYPHPDCPEHGDPQEEDPSADICGDGVEDLRYVREEDMARGPQADIVIVDEAAHFAETGELFDKKILRDNLWDGLGIDPDRISREEFDEYLDAYDKPEPTYRIKLVSCHDTAMVERPLDAAEMNFMRSLAKQVNGVENGDHGQDGCVPTLLVCQRIKPGDLDEDDNFRPVIEP